MPFRKLFLSRWSALLWAGGIIWTAVDTVGFAPDKAHRVTEAPGTFHDADGEPVEAQGLALLANALRND
ncbi:hypothetical protein [Sphingomonas sp. PAMC 26621]|uniref:hypothetical protein n=1 Tax=Sphingomonas sp. PAMC 26621 TaxID=1112213 RepID=UPI000288AC4D|nr:hypothetical protein [Sphingomonas sp. PAMC 26621]